MRLEVCHSASSAGKKMNSNQAFLPLFFLMQNGVVLDKNRDFFADFQFSLPTFNFVNLTPGFCQLDPYSLAHFADWSLALDFVNLTPNWPQNFNFLAI
jgi:hypothetical protein